MNSIGQARVDLSVVDISTLISQTLKGVVAFQGITERGEINTPTLVGSWPEYQRRYGGLMDSVGGRLFPLLCKRALERGCKLRINRIAHYTDITDKTTLTAVKAAATTTAGLKWVAASEGEWANGIKISTAYAKINPLTTVDIVVDLSTLGLPSIVKNFPRAWTQTDVDNFNTSISDLVKINPTGATNPITAVDESTDAPLVVTLAGGDYDDDSITETDYVGDSSQQVGLNAFDPFSDISRIVIPAVATPTMDDAVLNYADMRKDIRAFVRTPVGLTSEAIVNYRMRTGTYVGQGTRPNTWRGSMTTGGLRVLHPITGVEMLIPEVADVVAAASSKDVNYGEWFSIAGPKRGRIGNTLGVVYDLGNAARQAEADYVDTNGVNAVIDDVDYGTCYWGDSTLQLDDTLLKKENVAELVTFLCRSLRPLTRKYLFDPNDIDTWKAIYRSVFPLMENLKTGRAIWDYVYMGDQDIEDIADATINTPEDIDAGRYTFILGIKPKVNMKYIYIQVAITNVSTDFNVLNEPLN